MQFTNLNKSKKLFIIISLLATFLIIFYFVNSYHNFHNAKDFSLEWIDATIEHTQEDKERKTQEYEKYSIEEYWKIPENCPENNSERIKCVTTSAEGFMHNLIYKPYSIHTFDDMALLFNSTKYKISKLNTFHTCEDRGELYGNMLNLLLSIYETAEGVKNSAMYITFLEGKTHISYYKNKSYYLNKTEKEVLEEIQNETNTILSNMNNSYKKICEDIIEYYPKAKQKKYSFFQREEIEDMFINLRLNKGLIILSDCQEKSISRAKELNEKFVEERYKNLKKLYERENCEEGIADMIFLLGYLGYKNIDLQDVLLKKEI